MKLPVLLATLALPFSFSAVAQNALPPGYNHPPMAGHAGGDSTSTGAVAPYKFNPFSAQAGAPMAPVPPATNEGTVISIQSSGGYAYIEVTTPSGNLWLAAPETKLAAGDRIRYSSGAIMRNFSSKALNRSFPSIMFVGNVSLAGNEPAGKSATTATTAMPSMAPHNMAQQPAAPAAATEGTVISAQDAGGYSYVEVKTASGNTWLAAPMTQLKAGDTVRFTEGAEMRNFSSRALNKTFPAIQFIDQVTVVGSK